MIPQADLPKLSVNTTPKNARNPGSGIAALRSFGGPSPCRRLRLAHPTSAARTTAGEGTSAQLSFEFVGGSGAIDPSVGAVESDGSFAALPSLGPISLHALAQRLGVANPSIFPMIQELTRWKRVQRVQSGDRFEGLVWIE